MSLLEIITFVLLGLKNPAEIKLPSVEPLRGIYLTASTMTSPKIDALLDAFVKSGGTMVVFDIQSGGKFAYPSNVAASIELNNRSDLIPDLSALVKKVHDKNLYAAARFVLFKNGFLAPKKPEWTLKKKGTQRTFSNRDGAIWLDPGNAQLREYYRAIVNELADAGFDEVQFDYIRFPEAGGGGYIGYSFLGDDVLSRDQTITAAVRTLAETLRGRGVKTSIDIFGIVVWEDISWRLIGQNVPELARHVDAIYPMPYPSHFGPGWGGHANPGDEPYFFVQETTKKFIEQTVGSGVRIRPWLQGFAMNTSHFGVNYVRDQIRALHDIGLEEFAVWNASNNYTYTFPALIPSLQ